MKLSKDQELVCGINAINEIISIRPDSVSTLFFEEEKGGRIEKLRKLAKEKNIEVVFQNAPFFQKNFSDMNHQGVAIICNKRLEENENFLENIVKKDKLLLLILEHITDPHNVGAIIRSAEAFDCKGIIIPQRRSAGLTGTVAKVAAGALEHLPVSRVVNLNRSLEHLKKSGFVVIGLSGNGQISISNFHEKTPLVVIVGAEDKGISLLTQKKCDYLLRIPLKGKTSSLNASVAAAISLFHLTIK